MDGLMEQVPSTGVRAMPLVVTGETELRAELVRLCAAAGVTPQVIDRLEGVRGAWRTASCVVLGIDLARAVAALQLPRRDDVVLLTRSQESTAVYQVAVEVGASQVVRLPDGQKWMIPWLTDTSEGPGRAYTIGVVGGRGGAGASTFAVALSLRSARRRPTCLIDADPLSGGVELVLGSEGMDGLRWPDVAATQGRISAAAFRAALPEHRGVSVLSWSRGAAAPVEAATMRTMLVAASRSCGLLVLDLPRRLDSAATEALGACHHLIVVATADIRSVGAASVVLSDTRRHGVETSLLVRTAGVAGPTPEAVAEALGLSLAGVIPTRRSVARTIDAGLGLPARGPLARRCDEVLACLLPDGIPG
jgi:secretion/DNA translocation related CpaE-like protein